MENLDRPRRELGKLLWSVAAITLICDQTTKYVVVRMFSLGEVLPVVEGFFNLTLHYNPGAAFGLMAGLPDGVRQLTLAVTTAVALACIVYFLARNLFENGWGRAGIGLILGGAIGNICDRLRLGQVVDFLDFYVGGYHWPAFNVADSAICAGVAILLFVPPSLSGRGSSIARGEDPERY